VGGLALAATWGSKPGTAVLLVVAVVLVGAVLAAVHHAQVVAHRVGEPFGSLILAVAVTVIEVGLIVTLMVSERHRRRLAADRRAARARRALPRRQRLGVAQHGGDPRHAPSATGRRKQRGQFRYTGGPRDRR
jgi:NADH:ubiquinone oxidoreductase subunit K